MNDTRITLSIQDIDAKIVDLRRQAQELINQAQKLNEKADSMESIKPLLSEFGAPSNEPIVQVPQGPYHGIPVKKAAIQYLRQVGEPRGTSDIAKALITGGIQTTSKSFYRTLFNILTTAAARKNNPELLKSGDVWCLMEWM